MYGHGQAQVLWSQLPYWGCNHYKRDYRAYPDSDKVEECRVLAVCAPSMGASNGICRGFRYPVNCELAYQKFHYLSYCDLFVVLSPTVSAWYLQRGRGGCFLCKDGPLAFLGQC